jgi:hypothetical protein
MATSRFPTGAVILGLAVLGAAVCGSQRVYVLETLPPEAKIKVDGCADDWRGSLAMIESGDASLGVVNDGQDLFLCFVAEGSLLRTQIVTSGLTVWLDPRGGTKKALGMRYPGLDIETWQPRRPDEGDTETPAEDPSTVRVSGLEIIRGKDSRFQNIDTLNALGIEVGVALADGAVVYELKVPLLPSAIHSLAVGAPPGQLIGLGIDSTDPKGRKVVRRPLGGLPPMGGGNGWERGGGPGGYDMTPEAPKGVKFWGLVRLSEAGRDR